MTLTQSYTIGGGGGMSFLIFKYLKLKRNFFLNFSIAQLKTNFANFGGREKKKKLLYFWIFFLASVLQGKRKVSGSLTKNTITVQYF